MNKVILLVLLMPLPAFGQIMENFESGLSSGWIQSPDGHWNTDNANSISGMSSLHHSFDNAGSGNDRIGIAINSFHPGEGTSGWNFKLRYGCEPSSSNSWAIWLMSDAGPAYMPDNTSANGFAVGVNLTGYDDTLRLWKMKNGNPAAVVSTGINWQNDVSSSEAVMINIVRSASGQWTFTTSGLNGNIINTAWGYDSELFSPGWFVVSYKYTSTRDRLLWLDDVAIDGIFYEDNKAPVIRKCETKGRNLLQVSFDEEISETTLTASNFIIPADGNQASRITVANSYSLNIEFEKEFRNKVGNRLVISNLCDRLQNCRRETVFDFVPSWAEPGDVIISEIMADPMPAVSLPESEYFEIFNRTQFPFNLKNWIVTDGSQKYKLPERCIAPEQYLIVCSVQDTSSFNKYGRTLGLRPFPPLIDGGKILALCDSTNSLINGVEYSPDWYQDGLKQEGGWSLEIMDKDYPFYAGKNWRASTAREGGTPGKANSVSRVNPDDSFTGVENVYPSDSNLVHVEFSETVFGLKTGTDKIRINGAGIKDLIPSDPLLRKFTAIPAEPLSIKKVYSLTVSSAVEDFAGNPAKRSEFSFGIPERALTGDLLFNELLFNPLPEGSDYIEFYNSSDRILDASGLLLVSITDETGDTSEVYSLSHERRCILPGDYYVVTENRESIIESFPSANPERLFEVSSLPSMPDDGGHLVLFNRELDKIDEVFYDKTMHFSLLQSDEGISLEKIRNKGRSGDRSQWHSASEASGWGTPGIPNSISDKKPADTGIVTFSSTRITPDNDGVDDFLIIDIDPEGNGNVVSVMIFDETGRFVKKLTDNLFAGTEATLIWNGTGSDEKLVETGIYVFLIQVFDNAGKVQRWKKVCTVIRL
ncbi:MAG: lamin tail domain-containing protein [Bacteroidota bacterium]|nr:lamin tail domain-containing protein [Bacteroidota bacterium]